ncbi:MAG TPA: YdeI/OmpD-associated family protein [Candidatus Saccharimonadales bacterium]|nr:YdeI/OmpD-associated family protein [Candidatus Saccharimonadales bacterium]
MTEIILGLPAIAFATQADFEQWLGSHFADPTGIWVKIAKKNTGVTTATYDELLDVALCYGWIDGQVRSYDATYYLQRFTPRRAKSVWSLINTKKIAALTKAGRMQPSGIAAVEAAKRDGRWDAAYSPQKDMQLPEDFAAALRASPKAQAFYETLTKSHKFAFYYRIQDAKRPETRKARIEKFVGMLEHGEKLY